MTSQHSGLLARLRVRRAQRSWSTELDGGLPVNSFRRRALLIYAVLLLSLPSALGVQQALAPTRGWAAATLAAIGFELLYLSTSVLLLNEALQRFARRVALSAVGTAIVLNVLADYSVRVPLGLVRWDLAQQRFDPLALGLSLLESAPLAGLAYAGATLLHRLSAADVQLGDVVAPLRAALAQREQELAQQTEACAAADARAAQWRGELSAVAAQLAAIREAHAASLAQADIATAQLRAELELFTQRAAQAQALLDAERATAGAEVAQLHAALERRNQDAAEVVRDREERARQFAEAEREVTALRAQAAEQAEELAQLSAAPGDAQLDLPALAAALRQREPVSWREIEALLGRPQSTVRGWLAQRNGAAHAVDG